jgi:glycosyltransferase involved in cell wall biosynthesis
MIEALAAGTPVVGFGPTFEEIQDRMGTDIGEPVFEGTPEEVGAGLETVLAADWDRRRLRKGALRHFSPRRIAHEYAQLAREVATGDL